MFNALLRIYLVTVSKIIDQLHASAALLPEIEFRTYYVWTTTEVVKRNFSASAVKENACCTSSTLNYFSSLGIEVECSYP
jgi:hypothetical protein